MANRKKFINKAISNSIKDSNLLNCVSRKYKSNLYNCSANNEDRTNKFLGTYLNKFKVSYAQQHMWTTIINTKRG